MTVNGSLTTAIYINSAPVDGQQYILINGASPNSLHAGSGTFNLTPVVFNGGNYLYSCRTRPSEDRRPLGAHSHLPIRRGRCLVEG